MMDTGMDIVVMGHTTTCLLLIGFLVFCGIIYKKTRKAHRRGIKANRRRKKAGF